MVAEGAKSAPAVMALAEKYGVEMPIASDVYWCCPATPPPVAPFAACCGCRPAPSASPAELWLAPLEEFAPLRQICATAAKAGAMAVANGPEQQQRGISMITRALFLALVMAVNLPVPAHAANS